MNISFKFPLTASCIMTSNGTQIKRPEKDPMKDVKDILRDFLTRSGLNMSRKTPENPKLRADISEHMRSWTTDENAATLEKIVDCSCAFIETSYGHLSPEHQYFVALYTACFLYIDDLGNYDLPAVKQFAGRLTRGETQLPPTLESLAELVRRSHEMWTELGADAIIAGTLDAVRGMCIEYTTQDMEIKPQATWYPTYLRDKTGINPPYIHFIFMKSWRATAESYIQMLPYMEFWIGGANDILSFYKEELAGETKNYIHLRASAQQSSPIEVLRQHANELLAAQRNVEELIADDHDLAVVWHNYVEGFLEFHLYARRYKLSDLDLYEGSTSM